MEAIQMILANTPWWVYLILIALVKIGYAARHDSNVPVMKLVISPILFTYISIDTLIHAFQLNAFSVSSWGAGVLIGAIFGFVQVVRLALRVDRTHWIIRVPGSWSLLVYVLLVFAVKYYFGYQLGVDPAHVHQHGFEFAMLGLSGLFAGVFVGKFACYLYRVLTLPSEDLEHV